MSKRLEKFNSYKTHAWLCRVYSKLSRADLEVAVKFINENDHKDKGEFEFAINRIFLGREKPKHWAAICELLTCANSSI